MRALLERKFLPFVIKPGRYAGGEPGQIVKEPSGRLKYLIAFPDKYELGQSYLGLQTLYQVVNQDDRFLAERVFAVDVDAEELMRREGIPLFSLESSRPAIEFDAIGFTLIYELVYTNVLAMLDLAGVPLRSQDRTEEHPLIFAGGPAVYNPEPVAEFFDAFFIGDGEEGLPEMLSVLSELKSRSRREKLEALAERVESVYVPQFYDSDRRPVTSSAPAQIKARTVRELKPEYYSRQPILPLIDTVHAHLGVEIMRGCPRGCRFCQAGPIYRPVRARSQADIMQQIDTQLKSTGYAEVSLVSLSSPDYPGIDELADNLARRLEGKRISISLPSLRPGTISATLLDAVRRVRKSGLTLAPETGTERLRAFVRKDFPDSAIYDSVRMAYEKGWTTLKLYFMINLPTETEDDLHGIVSIVKDIHDIGREYPGRKTLNVTISPFVPKPHTPFQWDGIGSVDETLRKVHFLKRHLRRRTVNIKYHSVEASLLQGLLGRGGREMADVIETVYHQGCRFDGWSEHFQPDKWLAALEANGVDINERLQPIPFGADLPWSHIIKGPSAEHLQRERQRTSTQLREFVPQARGVDVSSEQGVASPTYGRGKKRLASRNTAAPTKNRVRLRWGKTARYRYMSHLDNMRFIERALRRAGVPVAYSQGFNPTMKLSFGPPLPLGFTSDVEFVDVTLETTLMPYMIDNLKQAMTEGMNILEAKAVLGKSRSLSAGLNRVVYRLNLPDGSDATQVAARARELLDMDSIPIERTSKEKTKTVNIRPAVFDFVVEDGCLEMVLGIGEGGYARPTEVAQLLFAADNVSTASLLYHRKDLYRLEGSGEVVRAMDL